MESNSEFFKGIEATFVKHAIKPHLIAPLSAHIITQLTSILEEQDQEKSEVGGAILQDQHGLELKVIKPLKVINLEKALAEFKEGKYDHSALLLNYLAETITNQKAYHSEKSREILFLNYLQEEIQLTSTKRSSLETRNEIIEDYQRYILGTSYPGELEELLVNSPYFRGVFHVHYNGSEPSPADISNNKKLSIPSLVLSATPKYKEEVIKLYLIHAGSFELLYQGLLQSVKKE